MIRTSRALFAFMLFFSLLNTVWSQKNIYWNTIYDPDCDACIQPGVTCKPNNCIKYGAYSCKNQNPPLLQIDDSRLIGLIKSGSCKYLKLPGLHALKTQQLKVVVDSCSFLSNLSGGRHLQFNDSGRAILPNMTAEQNAVHFKEMLDETKSRPSSALWLAQYYDYGIGTEQNRTKATALTLENAKIGNYVAQYALGFRYAYGIGAPKDKELAAKWLNKILDTKVNLPSKLDSPIIGYFFPDYQLMQLKSYDFKKQTDYCARILLNKINSED